jgi:WD40 repeat protein
VAWSPNGQRIVSGSYDQTMKVWDAASGQEALTLTGHTSGVSTMAFSPNGKRIVSGGFDQALKVWATASGQEVLTLKGYRGWVTSVAFSPDGKRIVSGFGEDTTAKVWDASMSQPKP